VARAVMGDTERVEEAASAAGQLHRAAGQTRARSGSRTSLPSSALRAPSPQGGEGSGAFASAQAELFRKKHQPKALICAIRPRVDRKKIALGTIPKRLLKKDLDRGHPVIRLSQKTGC
jgi:hypothetical protein